MSLSVTSSGTRWRSWSTGPRKLNVKVKLAIYCWAARSGWRKLWLENVHVDVRATRRRVGQGAVLSPLCPLPVHGLLDTDSHCPVSRQRRHRRDHRPLYRAVWEARRHHHHPLYRVVEGCRRRHRPLQDSVAVPRPHPHPRRSAHPLHPRALSCHLS